MICCFLIHLFIIYFRSCVVGCDANERSFLSREGLFLLFDLLEIAPRDVKSPVLGAILDLVDVSVDGHACVVCGVCGMCVCVCLCVCVCVSVCL